MDEPGSLAPKIRAELGACSLGDWPTPIEAANSLAAQCGLDALWLKREDRSSPLYGGNKVRGLEFLLAGAVPGTVFVTVGGTGSTHCLATAVHAARLSCATVLAQFPQPETDISREIAAACERAAARIRRAPAIALLPVAVAGAWITARRRGPARWIPGGGAHPRGVVGQVLGGLELASQLSTPPDAIVTPLGSGGTAAGLTMAMAMLRWPTRVVGVRVASSVVANRWRVDSLASGGARLLERMGVIVPRPAPLVIRNGLGQGYGYPSPEGEAARERAGRAGVELDPTYSAKAFAAVSGSIAREFRRVVFWHTFARPTHVAEPVG